MNPFRTPAFPLLPALVFLFSLFLLSCTSGNETSPYEDLLSKDPYKQLTDSIHDYPDNDNYYFQRAILLNKDNQQEPALADFQKAWSLRKEENYAVGISNVLLEKNDPTAIRFLQAALKELPESIFLQLSLARAYVNATQDDSALLVCAALLALEPEQANTLLLQAELLEKKGDISGAIQSLEKANIALPGNKEIIDKLMYLHAENKNPKALKMAETIIQLDSLRIHPGAHYIKGIYYDNIGDKTKAIEAFDDAIKNDHRYLNAYIEKGKILLSQNKIKEALSTFTLANTVSPSFPDAWYWIGRCQELMGQKAEAKLNYEKAYGLDKTFTEAKEAAGKL